MMSSYLLYSNNIIYDHILIFICLLKFAFLNSQNIETVEEPKNDPGSVKFIKLVTQFESQLVILFPEAPCAPVTSHTSFPSSINTTMVIAIE